jgi:hypothetical protein
MMTEKQQTFDEWAHMRLSIIVNAGRDDLRNLRNRFGLAIQGKLTNKWIEITDQEREDALYHIRKNG